jgi:hypothetical protein
MDPMKQTIPERGGDDGIGVAHSAKPRFEVTIIDLRIAR